ncbi:MAG: phosphatidylglycerophosphatase A [Proteobacteria bacterium]|nr:phosphatidylglycerophosphatase A [Pseudomonadota bacterium]
MNKIKPGVLSPPPGTTRTDPQILIATWFGAGLLRPAPGTIGSLAAIPAGYAIVMLSGQLELAVAAIALLVVGTISADHYGKKSGVVDDQSIVVDEVVGLWIAALPAHKSFPLWMLAFFLFRLFDIWKPWPASFFDNRSKGGFDVMMDDVVAGIYALLGVSMAALSVFT